MLNEIGKIYFVSWVAHNYMNVEEVLNQRRSIQLLDQRRISNDVNSECCTHEEGGLCERVVDLLLKIVLVSITTTLNIGTGDKLQMF